MKTNPIRNGFAIFYNKLFLASLYLLIVFVVCLRQHKLNLVYPHFASDLSCAVKHIGKINTGA